MKQWTTQRLFEAVDDWLKVHGTLPNSVSWNHSSKEYPVHPSFQTIWTIFGSLDAFLYKYKIHRRNWDAESVIDAFQEWEEINGVPPTVRDTRSERGAWLPPIETVVRIFGTWQEGLEAAGFIPLPRGVTRKNFERYLPMPRKEKTP